VHDFSWHGSVNALTGRGSKTGSPGDEKVPHALKFTKLRCMPDQMYVSVKGVRTIDDALVTIHLMLFYELRSIETMLDSTNDPIGDFINATSADVMTFGATNTYESLLSNTAQLSDLAAFPILSGRMAQVGFSLLKIVYRGYSASDTLQSMHDTSIARRTQLKLDADTRAMELEQQARDWANGDKLTQDIFGRQYIWNLFAHNSPQYHDTNSPKDGYNQEEWKMVEETPKIFEGPFRVGVTCIRVPVLRAHCESINLQFKRKVTLDEVYAVLHAAPGIRVVDDRVNNKHPEPLLASGEDEILVGRVRYDQSVEPGYGIDMFIAGDQLLKGAALNAVQIAELLIEK